MKYNMGGSFIYRYEVMPIEEKKHDIKKPVFSVDAGVWHL